MAPSFAGPLPAAPAPAAAAPVDPRRPKGPRFVALDGMRGLMCFYVAIYHLKIVGAGNLALDYFLVLSGFILAHRYLRPDKPLAFGTFAVHRVARLYPLHVYSLVVFAVAYPLVLGVAQKQPDGPVYTFAQQLTLTHCVGLNPNGLTWNLPSWSISVEFWVNLLFFALVTARTLSFPLLASALACGALVYVRSGDPDVHYVNYFGFLNAGMLRGWACFTLGILSHRLYGRIEGRAQLGAAPLAVLQALSLAGIAWFVFSPKDGTPRLEFLGAPFFALSVALLALDRGLPARVVGLFAPIGTISYSIYLNHYFVLLVLLALGSKLEWSQNGVLAVFLPVLLLYSAATYRWIEMPGQRLMRRIDPKRMMLVIRLVVVAALAAFAVDRLSDGAPPATPGDAGGEAKPKPAEAFTDFTLPASDEGVPGEGPLRRHDWFQDLWARFRAEWAAERDAKRGAIVFLGDSVTQGFRPDFLGHFPNLHLANRGLSGDTSRGMLLRLEEDVLALEPRGVVLLLGTNDIEDGAEPAMILRNLERIVAALRASDPSLPILICHVFPASATKARPAATIRAFNALIDEAFAGREGIRVLDTWSLFAGPDGDAKREEFEDLLHPNEAAYAKWAAALRPHLEAIDAGRWD